MALSVMRKTTIMKAIINELIFDKEMVNKIKQTDINKDLLYHELMSGRITMKEYLHLSR
jgi:hypothetical protein